VNALWISRLCEYKKTPLAVVSAQKIIETKIARENALLHTYAKPAFSTHIHTTVTTNQLLLEEARSARHFWHTVQELLPEWTGFKGRQPRGKDIMNKLLDVGYHHLTGVVKKFLEERAVPASLGLIHVPRTSDSAPLAYDLVEMFRADIVDAELLRHIKLKKKPFLEPDKEIAHFLHEVNERLEKPHYLKEFSSCRPYRYYLELQILKFIKAINHKEPFAPVHLPTRHDSRCVLTEDKGVV